MSTIKTTLCLSVAICLLPVLYIIGLLLTPADIRAIWTNDEGRN